jgi:IBR domain, a half RING-finger domain
MWAMCSPPRVPPRVGKQNRQVRRLGHLHCHLLQFAFALMSKLAKCARLVAGETSQNTCMICMDDMTEQNSLQMSCSHRFCHECWLGHFRVHVNEGTSCSMPCMAFRCGAICDQGCVTCPYRLRSHASNLPISMRVCRLHCSRATSSYMLPLHICVQRTCMPTHYRNAAANGNCRAVAKLLRERDADLLDKFERAIVTSYIEDNASARWCPSIPCCGRAIEALDDAYCEARCECGQVFCFKCGGPAHSPATCDMWRQWELKESDDSETVHYLEVCCSSMRAPPLVPREKLQINCQACDTVRHIPMTSHKPQ